MKTWEKAYLAAVSRGLPDSKGNKESYHRAWISTGKILGRKEPPASRIKETEDLTWLNE